MLYWWFRLDTSRSGARWIDGDIPAAGVRRRCDTQIDRQNEYFSPARTHYPLTRESCAKGTSPAAAGESRPSQASVSPRTDRCPLLSCLTLSKQSRVWKFRCCGRSNLKAAQAAILRRRFLRSQGLAAARLQQPPRVSASPSSQIACRFTGNRR